MTRNRMKPHPLKEYCIFDPVKMKTSTKIKAPKVELHLVDSISKMPAAEWNQLIGEDNLFLSIPFLNEVEKSLLGQMSFYYILYEEEGKTMGITYYQHFDVTGTGVRLTSEFSFSKEPLRYLLERFNNLVKKKINRINVKLLVNGNSFISGQYGHIFIDEIKEDQKYELINEGIKKVRSFVQKNDVNLVMVKDFVADSLESQNKLLKESYQEVVLQPNMVFELRPEWKSYSDYLQAMSSKYRVRAKSARKKAKDLIVESLGVNGTQEYSEQMYWRNLIWLF